jgi:hypothetical protein
MSPSSYYNGFLKDDFGNLSMMRLLSFMTWFIFAFMCVYQTITNTYNIWAVMIVGTLAFMPKVFQKIIEGYSKIKIEKDNG